MPIIFFENGRLGNQLFQYHGVRKYFPDEVVFFVGFKSLKKLYCYQNLIFHNKFYFLHLLLGSNLKWLFILLAKYKILSSVNEQSTDFNYKLVKINGIFNRFIVIHNVFFQHKDAQPLLLSNIPSSNSNNLTSFNNFIQAHSLQKKEIAFVHIRRGDYLFWPSRDFPAAIEVGWYLVQMEYFRYKYPQIQFIVFTDDKEHSLKLFADAKDVIISFEDEIVDFVIMAKCSHGILSASTFSWWTAYMAKISNPTGEFIAPKYWIGYNKKEWFPPWIESKWLRYV